MKLYFSILVTFFALSHSVNSQAIRVTSNEDCKFCIDRGWTHFCTNTSRNPNDPL
jgi:hypothetical protein